MPSYRPRITPRRLALLAMLLTATLCAQAQTSRKIKQLEKQRNELKMQLEQSQNLLNTTKRDVASELSRLSVIDARINAQQQFVDTIQREVSLLAGEIVVMQNQLAGLRKDLAACKTKYRRAVLYMNRNRLLQNRWAFIFMAKNFRQMYRRMRYAADYSKYLRAQGQAIQRKEKAVKEQEMKLSAALRDKDALLNEAKRQQKDLDSQKAQREKVVDGLKGKEKQLKNNIAQQKRKYANLNSQIDRLIKQEIAAAEARRKKAEAEARRRKEAEERRKRQEEARRKKNRNTGKKSGKSATKPAPPAKSTPDFRKEDEEDRTLSGNFRSNRGRLPIPITGSYAVTSRYGEYAVEGLSGVRLENKGINLTGRKGAQARSVFGGEVSAVAGFDGQYIVIIRHGGYFTVYSNLASVAVRQGQKVSTRQTIGRVATDANGNCTLQFQLRQKSGKSSVTVNPLPWLAR